LRRTLQLLIHDSGSRFSFAQDKQSPEECDATMFNAGTEAGAKIMLIKSQYQL